MYLLLSKLYYQVDMSRVKLDTIKPWIGKKLTEVLGMEDDVVVDFVHNQLEQERVCNFHKLCKIYRKNVNYFVTSVSGPEKDANQLDRFFKWKKCANVHD